MPRYYYHLTFELYPSSDPSTRERSERIRPASNSESPIWVPPPGTDIFQGGVLPSHPRRSGRKPAVKPGWGLDQGVPHQDRRQTTVESPRRTDGGGTSSREDSGKGRVIDCGASSREWGGETDGAKSRINIISEGRRRERTQSFPPPSSSAALGPRKAVRDWRFGKVNIVSVELDMASNSKLAGRGAGRGEEKQDPETPNTKATASAALELGPTFGGDGSTMRAECVSLPTNNTEVGWGVVHFYRGAQMPPHVLDPENLEAEDGTGLTEKEECSTLCIPSVPSYLLPTDFLGFVGEKWREDVTHFRMVMTSKMSRYLVLIKFRNGRRAREWQREFNGKVFNSMVVSSLLLLCHWVLESFTIRNCSNTQPGPDMPCRLHQVHYILNTSTAATLSPTPHSCANSFRST